MATFYFSLTLLFPLLSFFLGRFIPEGKNPSRGRIILSGLLAVLPLFTLVQLLRIFFLRGEFSLYLWQGESFFWGFHLGGPYRINSFSLTGALVLGGVSALGAPFLLRRGPAGHFPFRQSGLLSLVFFFVILIGFADHFMTVLLGLLGQNAAVFFFMGQGEESSPSRSGEGLFLVQRIGDFLIFLGTMGYLSLFGDYSFQEIQTMGLVGLVGQGETGVFQWSGWVFISGLLLKSSLFPFHGRFLLALMRVPGLLAPFLISCLLFPFLLLGHRLFFLWEKGPFPEVFWVGLGILTAFSGVLSALVQKDRKEKLIYYLFGQWGFSILGLGLLRPDAAFFCFFNQILMGTWWFFLLEDSPVVKVREETEKRDAFKLALFKMGLLLSWWAGSGLPGGAQFFAKWEITHGIWRWSDGMVTLQGLILAINLLGALVLTQVFAPFLWGKFPPGLSFGRTLFLFLYSFVPMIVAWGGLPDMMSPSWGRVLLDFLEGGKPSPALVPGDAVYQHWALSILETVALILFLWVGYYQIRKRKMLILERLKFKYYVFFLMIKEGSRPDRFYRKIMEGPLVFLGKTFIFIMEVVFYGGFIKAPGSLVKHSGLFLKSLNLSSFKFQLLMVLTTMFLVMVYMFDSIIKS